jgi:hypothetical protein
MAARVFESGNPCSKSCYTKTVEDILQYLVGAMNRSTKDGRMASHNMILPICLLAVLVAVKD